MSLLLPRCPPFVLLSMFLPLPSQHSFLGLTLSFFLSVMSSHPLNSMSITACHRGKQSDKKKMCSEKHRITDSESWAGPEGKLRLDCKPLSKDLGLFLKFKSEDLEQKCVFFIYPQPHPCVLFHNCLLTQSCYLSTMRQAHPSLGAPPVGSLTLMARKPGIKETPDLLYF